MPLTLFTGPANAEKAGVVLERVRASAERDPILVVPTFPDVERYRRELAEDGVVFGVEVSTFDRLVREIARRVELGGRPLGTLARERVVASVAASLDLPLLGASARTPGFAAAACRLFDELEGERITPQRWWTALRAWAAAEPARAAYTQDLAELYSAYHRRLERLRRRDAPLHAAAALDALRLEPRRWGATPVLLYGFDDLTPLQSDAVEALAATDAEVTLALTYERGRHAFAARGETLNELAAIAARVEELPPRAAHYAGTSRDALHHLERRLFEGAEMPPPTSEQGAQSPELTLFDDLAAREACGEPVVARATGVAAGDGVVFLEGGGERAELELVAEEAARLIREEGVAPAEIAVVFRRPEEAAALVAQVFEAAGVPVAVAGTLPFGHTALGRALCGLLRAATGGSAADLLDFLRAPGRVSVPGLVDRLEADVRREGLRTAAEVRSRWEADHFRLDALDRVAAAHRDGPAELLARLGDELGSLFAAPRRRAAAILDGAEAEDAQLVRAGTKALTELAELVAAGETGTGSPAELAGLLAGLPVRIGDRAAAHAVQVSDPQSLRARRVRALFACRLQEATFPSPARPEPFLDDDQRRALNAASGLRLRAQEDALGAERYLLYATVSRPQERLYLSWHAATDDGDPVVRSGFVDDVAGLFADDPLARTRHRDLGAVGGDASRDRLRAGALAGPRHAEAVARPLAHPEVVARLRDRPSWSASGLETWAGCPVKWFVERLLRPDELQPDAEPILRGDLAHKVLEHALRRLVAGGALTADRLDEARDAVRAAIDEVGRDARISVEASREATLRRRLEADLLRYVEHAVTSESEFVPTRFEQEFKGLDLGEGILIDGKIDRIDERGGEAILVDYKGKSAPAAARWVDDRKFQLAVYAVAARQLLGLEVVGAVYQPLGTPDPRARGALLCDADPERPAFEKDRLPREELDQLIEEAVELARGAAREARQGALEPRPDSCAWDGSGCAYPTICRCTA